MIVLLSVVLLAELPLLREAAGDDPVGSDRKNKRCHLTVAGRVQGVCFRMYCREEAERLGVTGWVRNRPDGTVEVLAEGDDDQLARLMAWCRQGPSFAHVTDMQDQFGNATGEFDGFEVTH